MIVVDSFIAFHQGSENDSAEIRKTMQGMRRLADAGATVILIHHSGKGDSTKEYRGSSDFKAGIDVGYVLANLSGDASRLTTLRLKAFKARFTVDVELVLHYRHGCFESDDRGPAKTVPELLQEFLVQKPGITTAEFETLAADKMLGRDKARAFLKKGVQAGTVRIEKGANNARYHTWVGDKVPDQSDLQ